MQARHFRADLRGVVIFRRRPRPPIVPNGEIVSKPEHVCRPPHCHEFSGDWKIDRANRGYAVEGGTVWRCNCGRHWEATYNNGIYGRRGLWLTWEHTHEMWKLDQEFSEKAQGL